MHNPFVVGGILSILWIGLRLIFGNTLPPESALKAGIFTNIFFVLMSIFIVFFFSKRKAGFKQGSAMDDMKLSLKGGIVYVVMISFSIFVFYKYIDTSLFDHKNEQIEAEISKLSQEDIIKRKNSQDATKSLTSEEYIKKVRENSRSIANPKAQTMFSALGLTVWCLLASVFCTLIFRKVLFAPRK